jgi:type IV fimbrial biogenesis protein FimT
MASRRTLSVGFTIIELMIVMVVVGVMVTIAAPSLRDLMVRIRLKTAASDLHQSLMYARSEAISRNAVVQVVPNSAANWALGWSVKEQAGGTVLSKQDPYQSVTFTTANAAYVAAALPSVTFSGTGRETGSAGAGVAVIVSSVDFPKIEARCVVVDPSGRAAVRQDHDFNPANGCN